MANVKIEPAGVYNKSFLLFRGALMNKEWIDDWFEEILCNWMMSHGTTSTSRSLRVAL